MINCAEMTRGVVVSARISPALLASVEEAAARLGLKRGQFVREAIQMKIDTLACQRMAQGKALTRGLR